MKASPKCLVVVVAGCAFLTALAAKAQETSDIVARVGDQIITLSQIDTMINSSSMVGLDIPPVGTSERDRARITILDKVITANLLYLDARKKGLDNDPAYQRDVERFSKGVLVGLYRERVLVGDSPVTPQEVKDFYDTHMKGKTELTEDTQLAIEAMIRNEKHQTKLATMRERLRKGVEIRLDTQQLDPQGDASRPDDALLATIDQETVTWGDIKQRLAAPSTEASLPARTEAVQRFIDERLMLKKALEKGLDTDPVYLARVAEYKKVRLVNIHRRQLLERFAPSDQELRQFYEQNKARIVHPTSRKVQMVVLKTKAEAEKILAKIQSGDITIYEAARDYSIDPNAPKTLGEIGWVSQGSGFAELDKLTFALEKDKIGGPVESPAGWHLVKVLDIRDALYASFDEENTRERTKRIFLHEKIADYASNLRRESFTVEVNAEALKRR